MPQTTLLKEHVYINSYNNYQVHTLRLKRNLISEGLTPYALSLATYLIPILYVCPNKQ